MSIRTEPAPHISQPSFHSLYARNFVPILTLNKSFTVANGGLLISSNKGVAKCDAMSIKPRIPINEV